MNVTAEDLFARRHNELIQFKDSNDFYNVINTAANLRQLLIDSTPLIHLVNRDLKCKIVFKVDDTLQYKLTANSSITHISTELGDMTLKYSARLKELSLKDFLNLKILQIENEEFTVLEIIKYASNKQGGVHFEDIKTSDKNRLKKALDPLEELKTPALSRAINTITAVTIIALRPLKDKLMTLPDYSKFLAHYDIDKGKKAFRFDGKKVWMYTNNMNISINDGFGWFGQISLAHQKSDGKRYIYEIGSAQKNGFQFGIYLTKDESLGCEVKLNKSNFLTAEIKSIQKTRFSHLLFTLSCVFRHNSNTATLEVYLNGELAIINKTKFKKLNKNIDCHAIGADIKGRRNATFHLAELALLRQDLSQDHIDLVNRYFQRKYRVT